MNPAPDSSDWLEHVQSRRLSPAAAAALRDTLSDRPREQERLQEELALNRLLDGLPAAPVASNFTAQVLAAVERTPPGRSWADRLAESLRVWARRGLNPIAVTAAVALTLGIAWQVRVQQRTELAASVAAVSRVAAVPGPRLFADFEPIQWLRTPAASEDVALMAALYAEPAAQP